MTCNHLVDRHRHIHLETLYTVDAWKDSFDETLNFHDLKSLSEYIDYWLSERAADQEYYGQENESTVV